MCVSPTVHRDFKRQPSSDNPDDWYSSEILDDLIAQAYDDQMTHPVLGLCVRPENTRAIELYRHKKFTEDLSPFPDKETGVVYNRMARILNADVLLDMLQAAKKKR